MEGLFLGIDTSNYKTSAALTDQSGNIVFERSEFLEVAQGSRGLRQSEAFFRHSNRLPAYISEVFEYGPVKAIGVSDRPRRTEGSYMPCFLAGVNAALEIGSALGVPVYRFSHQEGHAAAVLLSSDAGSDAPAVSHDHAERDTKCIFMHLSGGTTEFLICEADEHGFATKIIGGTKDISIGQLLDRAGVALGYQFPAGRYLDDTAYSVLEEYAFDPRRFGNALPGVFPKVKYDGGFFNLSGAETKVLRYLEQQKTAEEGCLNYAESTGGRADIVIAEMFYEISRLLLISASKLSEEHGIGSVCMAGGAASSRTVRRIVAEHLSGSEGPAPGDAGWPFEIHFGRPGLSGDNAVGTALLARRRYISETKGKR